VGQADAPADATTAATSARAPSWAAAASASEAAPLDDVLGPADRPPAAPPAARAASSSSTTPSSSDLADAGAAPRCPKCHSVVGARSACPSCGLAAARMKSFSADRDADIPHSLHASWRRVTEAWTEQPRHDAFVQATAAAGAFAWAAGQYQEARRRGTIATVDDPIAVRQLARVRRTAEAAMLASAAARPSDAKQPYRGATTILVMMVVVLIAGALYARFMRETRSPAGPVTPVLPAPRGALR
jgi:hypothetical protein